MTPGRPAEPGTAVGEAVLLGALTRAPTGTSGAPRTRADSLSESVYRRLKAEILACRLPPGSMLGAPQLAERFEVSRSPVTEALKRLEHEGLVLTLPRVGHRVTPVTIGDLQEIFDLRLMLEVPAAGLAARRAATRDVELLRAQQRRDDAHEQTASREDPDYIESVISNNREFHVSIATMSGNHRLANAIGALLDEAKRIYYLYFRTPKPGWDAHGAIIEALASRNSNAAREAMTAHVRDQAEGSIAEASSVLA